MTDLAGWGVVAHKQAGRPDMKDLLLYESSLRWVRVSAGPTAFNWDLGELEKFIKNMLSDRSFRPVFGLHDGRPDFLDIPRWHKWCEDALALMEKYQYGSGLIVLDAETSNPSFVPPGGMVEYVEAIDPVMDMIHAAGYMAMGPGNVNAGDVDAEFRHLDFILGEMIARGKPFNIPSIHAYPDQGKWGDYEKWLYKCEDMIRYHGYTWAVLGETGVAGDPWGFWQRFLAAIGINNGQRDWDSRQYDRIGDLRAAVDRHPFYGAQFFYQIIDGTGLGKPNADWGLTSDRYGPYLDVKRSIQRFQNDLLPSPEPYPDPVGPDHEWDEVQGDFLKVGATDGGWGLSGHLPTLSKSKQVKKIQQHLDREYTHIVIAAANGAGKDLFGSWKKYNFHTNPEAMIPALERLREAGLAVILFLTTDDHPELLQLIKTDKTAAWKMFKKSLKVWEPYISSVCPAIEWDEWGSKEDLNWFLKKIKKEFPDLPRWVHFTGQWTESEYGYWGYEHWTNADGLLYQQIAEKHHPDGTIERRQPTHIYHNAKIIAERCKRDGWVFVGFEHASLEEDTEAFAKKLGKASNKACRELGLYEAFGNAAK